MENTATTADTASITTTREKTPSQPTQPSHPIQPNKTSPRKKSFPLGDLVATPGSLAMLEESGQSFLEFIQRHVRGDWGYVCREDWLLNDEAIDLGERIFSVYETSLGTKLWVITEADRSSTCILLPEEY